MKSITLCTITLLIISCSNGKSQQRQTDTTVHTTAGQSVTLPPPGKSSVKLADVIGWPDGKMPIAPDGYEVSKFAWGMNNPRNIYIAPNGDILVAEANTQSKGLNKIKDDVIGISKAQNTGESANRITMFRDTDGDSVPEMHSVFLSGLNRPFGMLIIGNSFYVANTDALIQYPYKTGDTKITAAGKKILDLPAGGYNNHWTRNLLAAKDGSKIYVTVGSGTNVAEHGMENEVRRANILEINPDGSGEKIYASGLRNPVGMGWAPATKTLWTAVNERDKLGDDLVPDYLTGVKEGGFYGWPFAYFGKNVDDRVKEQRPDLVEKTIVPDVPLGSHTASLCIAFDERNSFGGKYAGGVFIGQHGSWNSSKLVGYQVAFVPFKNGKPAGKVQPFLTGFIADAEKAKVYGRPVGVAFAKDGSLLVADDTGNTIWRVSYHKK